MKKVVVILVFVMVLINSCVTRKLDVPSDGRRVESLDDIIGTWTDKEGHTWVFNADGKLIYQDTNTQYEYQCNVDNGKLSLEGDFGFGGMYVGLQSYDITLSSDGKTLFLTGGKEFLEWSVAGPGWPVNRLIRR